MGLQADQMLHKQTAHSQCLVCYQFLRVIIFDVSLYLFRKQKLATLYPYFDSILILNMKILSKKTQLRVSQGAVSRKRGRGSKLLPCATSCMKQATVGAPEPRAFQIREVPELGAGVPEEGQEGEGKLQQSRGRKVQHREHISKVSK